MKFGSVEFFKTMIKACLITLPVCLVLLISLSLWFAIYYNNTSERIAALEAKIEQLEANEKMNADISLGIKSGAIDYSSVDQLQAEQPQAEQMQYETVISDKLNNSSMDEQSLPETSDEVDVPSFDFLPDFWQPIQETISQTSSKTVYLTFDDGPSPVTLDILDTLDQYGIKATFFVVSRRHDYEIEALKEVVARGHSIGMHSNSHDPESMYVSTESFLSDMYENYKYIYEITGKYPQIFRFVGGSRSQYNDHAALEIAEAMTERGFVYFDWNSSADDATKPHPQAAGIVSNVLRTADKNQLIVLAHDSGARNQTAAALPKLIEELKSRGYEFAALDATVEPVRFSLTE